MSSAEGTYFVEALADTNRNEYGLVDFETLVGLEGVGIANVVSNREEVVGWNEAKKLKSVITYDDGSLLCLIFIGADKVGSSWRPIKPPTKRLNGDDWSCNGDLVGRSING